MTTSDHVINLSDSDLRLIYDTLHNKRLSLINSGRYFEHIEHIMAEIARYLNEMTKEHI